MGQDDRDYYTLEDLEKMKPAERLRLIFSKKKGLVCREFEKVCPTEASFKRMLKEMHDIFDNMERELLPIIKEETEEGL